jgi:hypothetical protein
LRRIAPLAALALLTLACRNAHPVKNPTQPPPGSTTTINWSTYVGKDLADLVRDVAVDAAGNTYVTGGALSSDLLPGTPVRAYGGNSQEDAFVAKFDASGAVVWWTFLGGDGPDRGLAIDLDPTTGDVVVGGSAAKNFPVTAGALLTTFQGGAGACDPTQFPINTTTTVPSEAKCDPSTTTPARDGFVAKLSGATGALIWSTYFGSGTFEANAYDQAQFCKPRANNTDGVQYTEDDGVVDFNDDNDPITSVVRDVAVDPSTGEIYLTFSVKSSLTFFPDPDLVFKTTNAGTDEFCDVQSDGPARPNVIRNLPAVVLAALQNGDQPNAPALDTAGGSGIDGILAKMAPDGASLVWATYVGGRGEESTAMAVRLDPQRNPVVLLTTQSSTVNAVGGDRVTAEDPVTHAVTAHESIVKNAFGLAFNGAEDFYLAKYSASGPLLWASYVGGASQELSDGGSLAIRSDGTIAIVGGTFSSNFATPGVWDTTYNGTLSTGIFGGDCAIALIAGDGSAQQAATYYGGARGEGCTGVAWDSQNRLYVTGGSSSLDLPLKAGPMQRSRPGPRSPFLAVFSPNLATLLYSGYFGGTGSGQVWSLTVRSDTATSGRVVFGGESEQGYPLGTSPARGTVTAPPAHGVVSDVTLGF